LAFYAFTVHFTDTLAIVHFDKTYLSAVCFYPAQQYEHCYSYDDVMEVVYVSSLPLYNTFLKNYNGDDHNRGCMKLK